MDYDDDYEVDDVIANQPRRKKKNSKDKGKRGELQLVKILNDRFDGGFSRVVGSGNRWGQTAYVTKDYIGDLVVPEGFKYTIECKFGYDIDLYKCLCGRIKLLDGFLKQATRDADKINMIPMLCWKKDRCDWLAFLPKNIMEEVDISNQLLYNDWVAVKLSSLLLEETSFFFD